MKRWWPPDKPRSEQFDCYEAMKNGTKTSEWRDATEYWDDRLFKVDKEGIYRPKVRRAWLIVGFPKGNIPRLEADIKNIIIHRDKEKHATQFEIQIENVVEVLG